MRSRLAALANKYWYRKAVVLMYHRVANLEEDVWELAVSPENFEQHLKILKNTARVISVPELVHGLQRKRLTSNCVAITFDDGYLDNYATAKPLLERYGLPATFFIASGNIGGSKPFWWDELQQIMLGTPLLPETISIVVNHSTINLNLNGEAALTPALKQRHGAWKASTEAPPTKRAHLFYQLWAALKPLPGLVQEAVMQEIRQWAGVNSVVGAADKSMSLSQMLELGRNRLFTIGAHTVSHPALALHPKEYQRQELEANKTFLEQKTGEKISALAYPYGNHNESTIEAAAQLHFDAAFTTIERCVTSKSMPFQLGRFQVNNWDSSTFQQQLQHWFKTI